MKKIIIVVCMLLIHYGAAATNLRGLVLGNSSGSRIPLANVRVDLYIWNGKDWINWAYAITGNDGYYYFENFTPGQKFCIQVKSKFYPPNPIIIQSINPPYYQDVPTVIT